MLLVLTPDTPTPTIRLVKEDLGLTMAQVVEITREAVSRLGRPGEPRARFGAGQTGVVVTPAGGEGGPALRAYALQRPDREAADDLTAIFETGTGCLRGVFLGTALGQLRTGAIGAVAVDALAPANLAEAAIIGCGGQALAQARALAAVRKPRVAVYCRSEDRRHAFVARVRSDTGLDIRPSPSAEESVHGAGLVIVATSSTSPVLDESWLAPDVRIVHVGPKRRDAADLPVGVYSGARRVVTDAPAELVASWADLILGEAGLSHTRVEALADAIGKRDEGPGRVVFCSLGLAGTEAFIARAALAQLDREDALVMVGATDREEGYLHDN